jgi:hypothetical protein
MAGRRHRAIPLLVLIATALPAALAISRVRTPSAVEPVEARPPTQDELSEEFPSETSCALEPGVPFSASGAGRWLRARFVEAGLAAHPAGSGLALELPESRHAVLAWATADDPGHLLPGTRQRVVQDVTLWETLEPLTVSLPLGGVRVWLAVVGPLPAIQSVLEDRIQPLETWAIQLAGQVDVPDAPGPPLQGGPSFLIRTYPAVLALTTEHLPLELGAKSIGSGFFAWGEGWWLKGKPLLTLPDELLVQTRLPDGSVAWQTDAGPGTMLVLAGGAAITAHSEAPSSKEFSEGVATALESANRCPWVGMPAQPQNGAPAIPRG